MVGVFCSLDVLHAKVDNLKKLEKSWTCEGVRKSIVVV